jgi:pimeloyl-ACP methyl ester carboxylesterase
MGGADQTYPAAKIIDPELARLLRNGQHCIIPAGTHDMWTEQPAACTAAIRAFLAKR